MSSNKGTMENMVWSIGLFGVNIILGLWLTPYLVKNLGIELYGYVPLLNNIINYSTVITLAVTGLAARFITISLKKGNILEANKYFNTVFYSVLVISGFLLFCFYILGLNLDKVIVIESENTQDVLILYSFLVFCFILALILTPFNTSLFYSNRLDINSKLSIIGIFVRVVLIIVLFNIYSPKLSFVGIATFVQSLIAFFFIIKIYSRFTPEIIISKTYFEINMLKEILSGGIWISINKAGSILLVAINIYLANKLLGPVLGGTFATISQWSTLVIMLVGAITPIFAPTLTHLYAESDKERLIEYTNRSIKIVGLLIAPAIGLILGFGNELLTLWIGKEFIKEYSLLVLLIVYMPFSLPLDVLHHLATVANRLKFPAIITIIFGIINIGLIILFNNIFNNGANDIALAGLIVMLIRSLFFYPVFISKIFQRGVFTFYKSLIYCPLLTFVFYLLCKGIMKFIVINTWLEISICSLIVILAGIIITVLFLLDNQERTFLHQKLKKIYHLNR